MPSMRPGHSKTSPPQGLLWVRPMRWSRPAMVTQLMAALPMVSHGQTAPASHRPRHGPWTHGVSIWWPAPMPMASSMSGSSAFPHQPSQLQSPMPQRATRRCLSLPSASCLPLALVATQEKSSGQTKKTILHGPRQTTTRQATMSWPRLAH